MQRTLKGASAAFAAGMPGGTRGGKRPFWLRTFVTIAAVFVIGVLFGGWIEKEVYAASAPARSYAIRSMNESDRVLASGDGIFCIDDWSGASSQYFRFESCVVGKVSGFRLVSASTGKVMAARSAYSNAPVVPVARRTDINQVWLVQYMKNGSVELLSAANKRYCLTIKNGSKDPGVSLVLALNAHKHYQQWTLTPGTITSALVGGNHRTITVKAGLTRILPSDDGRIYLFALPAYASSPRSGVLLSSVKASQSVTLKAAINEDTASSILQKKLILARKYKGYYFPISNGYFVTNPEAAATNQKAFPAAKTKKGLKLTLDASSMKMAKELGVSHVVVDFPIEAFLNGYEHSYTYEGKTYQFSSLIDDRVNRLKELRKTGAVITGVFYLSNRTVTDCILPSALTGSRYNKATIFALNTANANRRRLEALFSCLAEVFTKNDILVANWIYGNEVNNYNVYHYAGKISYFLYHDALADGFRLFNTAVKSKWKNARTYLSLDHNWNLFFTVNGSYQGMALTADFNKDLAGEGKIHWDMTMHPYPSPEMDCRFWIRSAYVTNSGASGQITMANAKYFAEYIKRTYGNATHIIMSETGLCAVDQDGTEREKDQAAAVALAYYLTEFDENIDMIGIHREMDEAGSEWLLGLYEYDGLTFAKSSARPSAQVFKYMDTPQWESAVGKYIGRTGFTDWPTLVRSFGLGFKVNRLKGG